MNEHTTLELREHIIEYLTDQNVTIGEIADEAFALQQPYFTTLTRDECVDGLLNHVLMKREVVLLAVTGLELDRIASAHHFVEPLQHIIQDDDGLYGVDEHIAIGMTEPYGSIATTAYGYLDKAKHGVAKRLDESATDVNVNTFVDDIVSALIADTSAYVAHNHDE